MNLKSLIGAHTSISPTLTHAIDQGEQLGATAIQIFLKSTTQWKGRTWKESEIQAWHKRLKNSSIHWVNAHASYLINLASKKKIFVKNLF